MTARHFRGKAAAWFAGKAEGRRLVPLEESFGAWLARRSRVKEMGL